MHQTHATPLSAAAKVVADSRKLRWKNAYASLTAARAWAGCVAPIEHPALVYNLRGINRVERRIEGEARSQVVTFKPRQLAFFPIHAPATFDVQGGADVLVIYLHGDMVRRVAEQSFGVRAERIHFRPLMGFQDPLLEQLCLGFAAALQRGEGPHDAAYVDHLAETIAAHGLRRYDPEKSAGFQPAVATSFGSCVQRVRALIDERLDDELSLLRLARHVEMTPIALTQAFRQALGVTPHQWVLARRIDRAARLLVDTGLPLAEIAAQTGFASQSHMSTMFKRRMARTPQQYRQGR